MKKYLPYIILIVAGLVLYGNTLQHGFVLDDHAIILQHKHVQNGFAGISDILSSNYLNGVQEFNDGLYRPLSPLIFAFQNEFWPNSPFPGHFFNVVYAIITSILIFRVFIEVFKSSINIALLFGVLFLAIPIHTEVVANIKGSDEMLALIFLLASMLFFNRYLLQSQIKNLIIGSLLFFVGLFAKESTFPFVVIIPLTLFLLHPDQKKHLMTIQGITGVLGGVFLLIRKLVLDNMPNPVDEGSLSGLNNSILATDDLIEKLGTALSLQVLYLFKTIVPYSLQHDYSFNQIPIVPIWSVSALIGLILLIGMLFLMWKYRTTAPVISIGFIWYLGGLIIVSNLLFPIGATFAERFLYTPSLGLCVAAFGFIQYYKPNLFSHKNFWIASSVVVAIYAFITINRNKDWKDNFTLYTQDYPKLQNSARGNYNYGTVCREASLAATNVPEKNRLFNESVTALKQAIKIYPEYYDAYNNLGIGFNEQKRYKEATIILEQLVKMNPTYRKGWFNLGASYYEAQDYANALRAFDSYSALTTANADVWYFKGMCYGFMNDFESAIGNLNQSIQLNPNHVDALLMLGKAHGIRKNYDLSEQYFNRVLSIQPNNQEALQNLQMTQQIKAMSSN
ncbi:tetratricopeptide repeat protein [bacterium SCSIO 12643]|nr:tetratricopeptide repeat protein [bacterium SCSIO 12643]